MQTHIYTVMVCDTETYTYAPVGVWTTRTLALGHARSLADSSEWLIVENALNCRDRGSVIWSQRADEGKEYQFYLRFWTPGATPWHLKQLATL